MIALTTFNVSVQMASPRWVVARALALYQMAAFGGMSLGSWLSGTVALLYGVGVALLCAATVQVAGLLASLPWRLPDVSDLDLDPQDRWREPATTVPVDRRSGPIGIVIEHRIAEPKALSEQMHQVVRRVG